MPQSLGDLAAAVQAKRAAALGTAFPTPPPPSLSPIADAMDPMDDMPADDMGDPMGSPSYVLGPANLTGAQTRANATANRAVVQGAEQRNAARARQDDIAQRARERAIQIGLQQLAQKNRAAAAGGVQP